MPSKAYCTVSDVADFLGVSLTSAQEVQAARLIESVTVLIDEELLRGFLVGVQTGEEHYQSEYASGMLYLIYAPVTSISQIRGRAALGSDDTVLVEDTDYEIISLVSGSIRLVNPGAYDRVSVDYTPVNTVPTPIRDATVEWVASRLMPTLRMDSYGLESYSLPDISVKFSRSIMGDGMPPNVKKTLDHYRNWARS
ncbi:MAG: hypothetical protein XU14_C0033G0010 [Armatimonadetes bacterium CSP1-3]|nr:MAG: hypothetical protein XU14_C0033G0010 [Armatimonadetes bacterium CSP1-3]